MPVKGSISLALKAESVQPEAPKSFTVTIYGRDQTNTPHEIEVELNNNEAYDLYEALDTFINR